MDVIDKLTLEDLEERINRLEVLQNCFDFNVNTLIREWEYNQRSKTLKYKLKIFFWTNKFGLGYYIRKIYRGIGQRRYKKNSESLMSLCGFIGNLNESKFMEARRKASITYTKK